MLDFKLVIIGILTFSSSPHPNISRPDNQSRSGGRTGPIFPSNMDGNWCRKSIPSNGKIGDEMHAYIYIFIYLDINSCIYIFKII